VGVRGTVVLSLLFSSGQEMWVSSGRLREWHWLCEHLARHSSATPAAPGCRGTLQQDPPPSPTPPYRQEVQCASTGGNQRKAAAGSEVRMVCSRWVGVRIHSVALPVGERCRLGRQQVVPAVECSSAEGNQQEGGWIGSCVSTLHSNKAHHLPCLRLSVCWRGWDARLFWSMIPRGAHPSQLATHNSVKLPQLPGCSSAVHQWCLWESAWGCACSGVTCQVDQSCCQTSPPSPCCALLCVHTDRALKKLPSTLSLPSLPTLPTLAFTPHGLPLLCSAVFALENTFTTLAA
jgi:hypothetical protein